MYRDEFKSRYLSIPLATFSRRNSRHTLKEDHTTLSHMHREMEVLAIIGGTARFNIDNHVYDVKKGDILIISPFVLHNATIYAGMEFEHYCLCFDLKMISNEKLRDALESGRKRMHCFLRDHVISRQLFNHIEQVFQIHSKQNNGWELQVTGHLSLMLGLLDEYGCYSDATNHDGDDINRQIIDYIDNNYDKNISSASLASALFISKSYFCRIFKKNFGCHFQQYLCLYRMEKAKRLLRMTQKPVADIAMETGFTSFSYFSKMFKAQLQMTPSEYRKSTLL